MSVSSLHSIPLAPLVDAMSGEGSTLTLLKELNLESSRLRTVAVPLQILSHHVSEDLPPSFSKEMMEKHDFTPAETRFFWCEDRGKGVWIALDKGAVVGGGEELKLKEWYQVVGEVLESDPLTPPPGSLCRLSDAPPVLLKVRVLSRLGTVDIVDFEKELNLYRDLLGTFDEMHAMVGTMSS